MSNSLSLDRKSNRRTHFSGRLPGMFAAILLLVCCSGFAQTPDVIVNAVIKGKVTDSSGNPVIGATVVLKGTSEGTTTATDGTYSLRINASNPVLVFSYIGYESKEVKLARSQLQVNVTLAESAVNISDVVVVGYGTQKRSEVTGAVASIKTDEMLLFPSSNVGDLLRGRAAGVDVTSSSGRPGSAPKIRIRGDRSLMSSGNEPLYIIDGAPATEPEFNSLNPEDIQSIDILKDAASQAVYGARAASGVILITTKRGEAGTTRINFNASVGIHSLWKNFDYLNAEEYYQLRREALITDSPDISPDDFTPETVFGTDSEIYKNYIAGNTIDWEKEALRTGVSQQYDLSLSGGTEKLRIATGMGYSKELGISKFDSGFQRGNLRLNVDWEAKKWLLIGFNSSYSKQKQGYEDSHFQNFVVMPPIGRVYDDFGSPLMYIDDTEEIYQNPIYNAQYYTKDILRDQYRINGFIEIRPLKNLSYRFNASYYNRFTEEGEYKKKEHFGGGSAGSVSNNKYQDYLIENILNYTVPFKNQDHKLELTAVQSYNRTVSRTVGFAANQVPVDDFDWDMLADGAVTQKTRSFSENVLLSYVGRLEYGFKERYLLSAVVRHDGSSKFGPANKWGTFPSVSAAWRISEEPFMKNIDFLSNLKLRASYGKVGSDGAIGNYTALGNANSYDMEFGDNVIVGYLPSGDLPNKYLKWETTASTNLGLDFGFFNNRLSGTIETFFTKTTDLLVHANIPSNLGYSTMWQNMAESKTQGVEFSLTGDIFRKKDFRWSATFNIAAYRSKIVKVTDERDENGNYVSDIENKWFIGGPLSVYYDYVFDGIYQYSDFDVVNGQYVLKPTIDTDGDGMPDAVLERSNFTPEPGTIKLKDLNGDGKINSDDQQWRKRDPDFTASLSTSIAYKGFDFYMDWYFRCGGEILNPLLYDYTWGGQFNGKKNSIKVDYWTPSNPSNTMSRPKYSSSQANQRVLAYQDASYVRLRSLTLGYTLPRHISMKAKLQKLRVYVTATNLFTSTDFLSYSPEFSATGYPETRQWVFGINIGF